MQQRRTRHTAVNLQHCIMSSLHAVSYSAVQVSQLSGQVQELLSSKAAMTAAHRQEVAALQEKLRAGAAALEKEKVGLGAAPCGLDGTLQSKRMLQYC